MNSRDTSPRQETLPENGSYFCICTVEHKSSWTWCIAFRCASGCVVECRICNREVAGSNLGRGYFAPRSTQPSIPPGSVNEYQLRLGRQRQVWPIPWDPLRTRAIPERFCGGDSLWRGAMHLQLYVYNGRLRDTFIVQLSYTSRQFGMSLARWFQSAKLLDVEPG